MARAAKDDSAIALVDVMIDEATTLVIGGNDYAGAVTVDPDTAKQLLETGRASVFIAATIETNISEENANG